MHIRATNPSPPPRGRLPLSPIGNPAMQARDIFVFELETMLRIVCGLTEQGHGFEVEIMHDLRWRIRLTGTY